MFIWTIGDIFNLLAVVAVFLILAAMFIPVWIGDWLQRRRNKTLR